MSNQSFLEYMTAVMGGVSSFSLENQHYKIDIINKSPDAPVVVTPIPSPPPTPTPSMYACGRCRVCFEEHDAGFNPPATSFLRYLSGGQEGDSFRMLAWGTAGDLPQGYTEGWRVVEDNMTFQRVQGPGLTRFRIPTKIVVQNKSAECDGIPPNYITIPAYAGSQVSVANYPLATGTLPPRPPGV